MEATTETKKPIDGVLYFLPKDFQTSPSLSVFKDGFRILNWCTDRENSFTDSCPMQIDYFNEYRLATKKEKQILIAEMHKKGVDFDFKKLEFTDYKTQVIK